MSNFAFTSNTNGLKRKHGLALIPVCIGWQNSEGQKFRKFVETARITYKEIILIVADDLYAYVQAITKKSEFKDELSDARQMGKDWVERNKNNGLILSDTKVIHWHEFEKSSHYSKALNTISQRFKDDEHFRSAIDVTIRDRLNNPKYKKASNFRMPHYTENSEKYVLDECVKYLCWAYDGFNFIAHLDDLSVALQYVYTNLIRPEFKDRAIYDKPAEVRENKQTRTKSGEPIKLSLVSKKPSAIANHSHFFNNTQGGKIDKIVKTKNLLITDKQTKALTQRVANILEQIDNVDRLENFVTEIMQLMGLYQPGFDSLLPYLDFTDKTVLYKKISNYINLLITSLDNNKEAAGLIDFQSNFLELVGQYDASATTLSISTLTNGTSD